MEITVIALVIAIFVIGYYSIVIVKQQEAYVIERLGKFRTVLGAGLKFIIPFIDQIAYRHSLKEIPLDVPSQVCITRDNIQLGVDGIIFYQVTDPKMASYGTSNFQLAITQLSQTTLRSIIGRMELDKTFEERDDINRLVVAALDEASVGWGVKVLRYEIKDLNPPKSIVQAMQAQTTAEREKRARIATSEGMKIEQINLAQGERESAIKRSEGDKFASINRAQGEAEALKLVADATAQAISMVAEAMNKEGGMEAVNFKVAERYVDAFSNIAQTNNTLILPANIADLGSLVAASMKIVQSQKSTPQTMD